LRGGAAATPEGVAVVRQAGNDGIERVLGEIAGRRRRVARVQCERRGCCWVSWARTTASARSAVDIAQLNVCNCCPIRLAIRKSTRRSCRRPRTSTRCIEAPCGKKGRILPAKAPRSASAAPRRRADAAGAGGQTLAESVLGSMTCAHPKPPPGTAASWQTRLAPATAGLCGSALRFERIVAHVSPPCRPSSSLGDRDAARSACRPPSAGRAFLLQGGDCAEAFWPIVRVGAPSPRSSRSCCR